MISANDLLTKISNSFQTLNYPGDENIVYDNSNEHLECFGLKQKFRGKHWNDIADETLNYEKDALCFFTPAAFRFYLPAYLRFVIKEFERADSLPSSTVAFLTLPVEADDLARAAFFASSSSIQPETIELLTKDILRSNQKVHRFIERFAKLSYQQGQAIYSYLKYLQTQHANDFLDDEPLVAIERYWFIFEDSKSEQK
jgi:hypothetical protein